MTKRGNDNCLYVYEGCKLLRKEKNFLISISRNLGEIKQRKMLNE